MLIEMISLRKEACINQTNLKSYREPFAGQLAADYNIYIHGELDKRTLLYFVHLET